MPDCGILGTMSYTHIFKGKESVLVVPDTQAPYHHKDTIPFLKAVKKLIKPTKVIHIGDITDQHSLSFYTKNPDLPGAEDEFRQSEKFLHEFFTLFPEGILLESNHDSRIYRIAEKAGLPTRCMRPLLEIINAPKGWRLRTNIEIDGIFYEHGDKGVGGKTAALGQSMDNMKSTVIGHHHSLFAINYFANPSKLVFGMSVGSLLDHKALAFAYSKFSKKKSILGCAAVIKGFPMLIPMMLNKHGRWTKELPTLK